MLLKFVGRFLRVILEPDSLLVKPNAEAKQVQLQVQPGHS